MARIKYDVRGVQTGERKVVPQGVYNAKVTQADVNKPDGKDQRIEVVLEIVNDKEYNGAKLFEYINLESEAARWKLREFLEAVGTVNGSKSEAGTIDTDKIVGTIIGVKTFVRAATEQFEESARVRRMFPIDGGKGKSKTEDLDDEVEDDDEDEEQDYESMSLGDLKAELKERELSTRGKRDALIARLVESDEAEVEEEEEEAEEEEETESESYSWEDIENLSRAELRQLIKDEELEVKVLKTKSDDDLKAEVAAALDIEVEEAEEEDEEDEKDEDDYESWSLSDLKEELSQRSLSTKGGIKTLVARLRKDDSEEEKPF